MAATGPDLEHMRSALLLARRGLGRLLRPSDYYGKCGRHRFGDIELGLDFGPAEEWECPADATGPKPAVLCSEHEVSSREKALLDGHDWIIFGAHDDQEGRAIEDIELLVR